MSMRNIFLLIQSRKHLLRNTKIKYYIILGTLGAITLYRCLFFLIFPDSNFNSDGAIMGIMTNDILHHRYFPSTFYGQKYLLGVEAYLAVPFFLLFGSSIVSLKLPLFLMNFIFVFLLFYILYRELKSSLFISGLTTMLIAAAPLRPSVHMMMPDGANIEPYIYILLTWLLRKRTYLLGFLLAFFYWHREFTILGFLALIVVDIYMYYGDRNGIQRIFLSRFLTLCTAFASYHFLHSVIKKSLTYFGSKVPKAHFSWTNIYENTLWLVNESLPSILGFKNVNLEEGGLRLPLSPLYEPLLFPLQITFIFLLLYALFIMWKVRRQNKEHLQARAFTLFLITVAILNFLITALFLKERSIPLFRYNLLFLFFPIGIVLWNLQSRFRTPKYLSLVFITLWSLSSLIGYKNLYLFFSSTPADEKLELVKFLEQSHIKYAKAPYWDAYYLTFISQERVKVSSSDHVRVGWIQDLVHQHQQEAVLISRSLCLEGKEISQFHKWSVCRF